MNSTVDCRQYLEPNPEIVGIGVLPLYWLTPDPGLCLCPVVLMYCAAFVSDGA
jgi:hypothetical protein